MKVWAVNREPKSAEGRETALGFEISKRLPPDFAVAVGWEYLLVNPPGGPRLSGGANPDFNFKYVVTRSPAHEAIVSIGLSVAPGGVGSRKVAEKVTTLSPALYFGKGLGDLPDTLAYLKPLAVTGAMEVGIPANRRLAGEEERHSTTLGYGFAVQDSIPYLQTRVKERGIRAPSRSAPSRASDRKSPPRRPG